MSLVIAAVALHRFTEFLRRLGSIPTVTGCVAVLLSLSTPSHQGDIADAVRHTLMLS
jgi:hypothetical protein